MTQNIETETTITEDDAVTVPASIREAVGLEPGDTLRWRVTDGELSVEVVTQREGAFSELDPVDTGESTHAAEDHDRVAGGR